MFAGEFREQRVPLTLTLSPKGRGDCFVRAESNVNRFSGLHFLGGLLCSRYNISLRIFPPFRRRRSASGFSHDTYND